MRWSLGGSWRDLQGAGSETERTCELLGPENKCRPKEPSQALVIFGSWSSALRVTSVSIVSDNGCPFSLPDRPSCPHGARWSCRYPSPRSQDHPILRATSALVSTPVSRSKSTALKYIKREIHTQQLFNFEKQQQQQQEEEEEQEKQQESSAGHVK